MLQCPEGSFLAQLQPLSPCVLGNAKTGCTAGAWKLLVCESCVEEKAVRLRLSWASETQSLFPEEFCSLLGKLDLRDG